jgi:enoyl-CoA hydratase
MPDDPPIVLEKFDQVSLVRLNQPQTLNALSPALLGALCDVLEAQEKDARTRAIILAGGERAFAAGADIPTMATASPQDMIRLNTRSYWQRIRAINLPMIAAVRGFAYGGGCELALQCDLIIAAEDARFAQPEIKLGIMPGAGGTQRLARALGQYRAMEMILTGEPITGLEAYQYGLINRAVPAESVEAEALVLARLIASRPPIAVRMAREAIRLGMETTMRDGLEIERRNFLLLFDTQDQKEGMQAFLEKRPPIFKGE